MSGSKADIAALLGTREWKFAAPPVREDVLEAAKRRMNWALPQSLIDLHRLGDVGEGTLRHQPWNFVLWGVQDVAELRNHVHYKTNYPDLLFIGSSGGGEYFGLDRKG